MAPSTDWIEDWVGSRASLNAVENRKFSAPAGNRTPVHEHPTYSLVIILAELYMSSELQILKLLQRYNHVNISFNCMPDVFICIKPKTMWVFGNRNNTHIIAYAGFGD
jgi:hypothetical protein